MIIEKSVKIIVIKFFFILRLFNKIKRFERWETVDIFPYHVFKKLNIKWIELYPVRLKRERGLEVLIKIHVRSSRTNSTIVDYMYFKDDLITRQVYTHSDSDRWPWSSTSPCWPCCGSRGSWEESEGGETFLTRGRFFFTPSIAIMYKNFFKKEKIETIFCWFFLSLIGTFLNFIDISLYFLWLEQLPTLRPPYSYPLVFFFSRQYCHITSKVL